MLQTDIEVPKSCDDYVKQLEKHLLLIQETVLTNVEKSQFSMLERENTSTNSLYFQERDYVYLLSESTGQGQKLKPKYIGPLVISKICSDHMVMLRNPTTGIFLKHAIHVKRLKPAFVREPSPNLYFKEAGQIRIDSSVHMTEQSTQTLNIIDNSVLRDTSHSVTPIEVVSKDIPSRPKRTIRKPIRFRDGADTSDSELTDQDQRIHIIAQRKNGPNLEYLVRTVGDPSQQAVWLPQTRLNDEAKRYVQLNPPPCV